MAVANAEALWPEGNEWLSLPSGRVRPAANLIACAVPCETSCARKISAPTRAARGESVMRPMP